MAGSIRPRRACSRRRSASIGSTLRVALRHPVLVVATLLATIWLNYDLFRYHINYGLFPVQDTGLIIGSIQADQSISFQSMEEKFKRTADDRAGGPGGRQRRRLHRRTADELRLHLCVAEALQAERKVTADERREPAARQARRGGRRAPVHGGGVGSAHRRPPEQRDLPVHAALRRRRRSSTNGRRS